MASHTIAQWRVPSKCFFRKRFRFHDNFRKPLLVPNIYNKCIHTHVRWVLESLYRNRVSLWSDHFHPLKHKKQLVQHSTWMIRPFHVYGLNTTRAESRARYRIEFIRETCVESGRDNKTITARFFTSKRAAPADTSDGIIWKRTLLINILRTLEKKNEKVIIYYGRSSVIIIRE